MAEPGLALCSLATSPSASAAGSFFALSVQTFERGRHLFLGADAEGAAAVRGHAWARVGPLVSGRVFFFIHLALTQGAQRPGVRGNIDALRTLSRLR